MINYMLNKIEKTSKKIKMNVGRTIYLNRKLKGMLKKLEDEAEDIEPDTAMISLPKYENAEYFFKFLENIEKNKKSTKQNLRGHVEKQVKETTKNINIDKDITKR